MKNIKCVVVGDASAKKAQLLFNYAESNCSNNYCPLFIDNFSRTINIKEKSIKFHLFDTSGQEKYENLRAMSYKSTDVFIICFSLNDPESLTNVKNIWAPEIKKGSPKAKIILVGTILNNQNKIAESKEGKEMMKKIGAYEYVECDLSEIDQVTTVFDKAIKSIACSSKHSTFKKKFLSMFNITKNNR